jgi:uncharacterized metal-binding protein
MTQANSQPTCCCAAAPKLIFSCSGAADVGEISDRAARKLSADGAGKMFCLAGVGGRVSGIMASTQAAAAILAIDGCPLDCTKKTLEEAGFKQFAHIRLNELGMEKGKSPVTDERIGRVVSHGKERLVQPQT